MSFYTHDNTIDSPLNNFCTLSTLWPQYNPSYPQSNGNLTATTPTSGSHLHFGTMSIPRTGKWYFEIYFNSGNHLFSGIAHEGVDANGGTANYYYYYSSGTDYLTINGSGSYNYSLPHPASTGSVIGYLIDLENSNGKIYVNNQLCFDKDISGLTALKGNFFPSIMDGASASSTVQTINFGQDHTFGGTKTGGGAYIDANGIGQFYYEPPEGALALCTANIPSGPIDIANDDVPSDYMKVVTWTGDSQNPRSITVGFQPDLIIAKRRNAAGSNWAIDSLRGKQRMLSTDTANSEDVNSVNGSVESFDSDGFSLKGINTNGNFNNSGITHVAWCWKAAGAPADNQARIIDTDGSLITKSTADLKTETSASITPSKVSANRKSGFSIVNFNSGSANSTASIPHGLGQRPDFVIVKNTNTNATAWFVWHSAFATPSNYLYLHDTFGLTGLTQDTTMWGNGHDINKIGFRSGWGLLANDNHIAYCWHSVSGYSKFGSYVGNGSADGPFVYTGFSPAFILLKQTTSNVTEDWGIVDNTRDPYNSATKYRLFPNNPNQEDSNAVCDFLSNGFKVNRGGGAIFNVTGTIYIYAAFAESPFNAPATAR